MSFLSDITGWFTGGSTGAALARTALLGVLSNKMQKSIDRETNAVTPADEKIDYGVRETVDPDTEYSIPVLYGRAFVGGTVTDAVLSADNQTMWYCVTLCEATGVVFSTINANNLTGTQSVITFENVYWNSNRMLTTGGTVSALFDADGKSDSSISGLVEIYAYNRGSANPIAIGSTIVPYPPVPAWERFPGWTTNHTMDNLVFALVKVTYSSEKNITGLGTMKFKLKNSITTAGDVLYDYMTNTRYGAGLTQEEIFTE